MIYPSIEKYTCKYCGRKFESSTGLTTPRLIEHLLRQHPTQVNYHKNLYLSDIIKKCYKSKWRNL